MTPPSPLELLLIGTIALWICTCGLLFWTRRRLFAADERHRSALGEIRRATDSQLAELRAHGAAVIGLAERFDALTRRWDVEATHRALAAARAESPAPVAGERQDVAAGVELSAEEVRLAARLRAPASAAQVSRALRR